MKSLLRFLALLLLFVLLEAITIAQTIEYLGSTLWGQFNDIAVQGNYAFCASSSGLLVLDISDPQNLSEAANYLAISPSQKIIIHDNYAFMANEKGGLQIFNISDPLSAELLDESYDSIAANLAVSDNRAFLYYQPHSPWGDLDKLAIYDISTPANIVPLGAMVLDFEPAVLTPLNDSLLILSNLRYLSIYNVSMPANPDLVSQLIAPDYVSDILVLNNYAFAAATDSGLQVVDISDVTNPHIVSRLANEDGDEYTELLYADGKLYALALHYVEYPATTVLLRINIDDPLNPVLENRFDLGHRARDLGIINGNAFLIDGYYSSYNNMLHILDISSQPDPAEIGQYAIPSSINNFVVSGSYVYSAIGGLGVGISELTDPRYPVTSRFEVPEGSTMNICRFNNNLYTYNYDYYDSINEIGIYDVSDPLAPLAVGTYIPAANVNSMYADSALLILSEYGGVLRLLDISDPVNPAQISELPNTMNADNIHVFGHHIYLTNQSLQICNISDLQQPYIVSDYDNVYIDDILVRDNIAYAVGIYSGLNILDISNPASPILIAHGQSPLSFRTVGLQDNLLFTGAGSAGLFVWDISDVYNPRVVDSLNTPNSTISVQVDNGYLYVNDQKALLIFAVAPTGIEEVSHMPTTFTLSPNYPNPFNAQTTISYSLPEPATVTLDIFDILGRQVQTLHEGRQSAGEHSIIFLDKDLPSGLYLYKLTAGEFSQTRKMMLLK